MIEIEQPSDPEEPHLVLENPAPQSKKRSALARASSSTAWVLFNIIVPILLLLGGAAVVFLLGKAEAPPRDVDGTSIAAQMEALAAVRVAKLQSLESTGKQLQLEVDGNVVPFREALVAAEVAGRIVFKDPICEAGSVVKKGQLLMKIDDTDYKLEVDRLTRQKEQAYQSLQEVDQEMVNANRSMKLAKQDYDLQNKEVKRQESLPKGFSSRGEIDQAKRALLQSEQQMVNNQNSLDLLAKKRRRLETSEQLAGTQLRVAQLNLKRVEIVAPIDGVIVREDADLNTFVNRGSTLVTIDDISKVEVATNLRMDQLYWVQDQVDQDVASQQSGYDLPETPAIVEYELNGRDDHTYRWKGRLLRYDGIGLDERTRTVPVRVVVDNPRDFHHSSQKDVRANGPGALVRGMYVKIKLLITPKTPLVVIPGEALQPGNRVWQFVADESVIDKTAASQATPSDSTAKNSEAAASDTANESNTADNKPKSEPEFNSGDWIPGRVLVQKSVYPVDTLSLADANDNEMYQSGLADERRYWVCETNSENFGSDSFVVTSPLNAVSTGGLPARTMATNDSSESIVSDQPVIESQSLQSPIQLPKDEDTSPNTRRVKSDRPSDQQRDDAVPVASIDQGDAA